MEKRLILILFSLLILFISCYSVSGSFCEITIDGKTYYLINGTYKKYASNTYKYISLTSSEIDEIKYVIISVPEEVITGVYDTTMANFSVFVLKTDRTVYLADSSTGVSVNFDIKVEKRITGTISGTLEGFANSDITISGIIWGDK